QCMNLKVPLDHAHPGGKKITLALSRIRHRSGGTYQGVLLVNPGGPGGTGRDFAATVASGLPGNLRQAYDVIGFDPRGVGASRPALSCRPHYSGPGRPAYGTAEKAWLKRTAAYARACGRKYGPLLAHMRSEDAVRDMDLIRAALGVPQINYYGGSYGTYLGAVYATLFPGRVRRMVLDSNVRPSGIWYQDNLDQDLAFQQNLQAYFAWIGRHHKAYRLGRSGRKVARRFYATRDSLNVRPAGKKIGGNELTDLFQIAGYTTAWWAPLAGVLARWVHDHDSGGLRKAYQVARLGHADNDYAVYNAVQCTDVAWPRSWRKWRRDAVRTNRRAPFGTWQNTWFNAPCRVWPAAAGKPVRIRSNGAFLLLQATHDAATPYRGGIEMHRLIKRSRLIVENGGRTHVIAQNGNPCVDDRFYAYLSTGALPGKRVTHCARLSYPTP
ncbi:MAG: alpha/beta fold hydrolase, partial [Streptosporangiaceae bacterium]